MKEVVVKRGCNGFKYSVYTASGVFIFNAGKMKLIRDHFRWEVQRGFIAIRKEL